MQSITTPGTAAADVSAVAAAANDEWWEQHEAGWEHDARRNASWEHAAMDMWGRRNAGWKHGLFIRSGSRSRSI
jgi:hypothetical protein